MLSVVQSGQTCTTSKIFGISYLYMQVKEGLDQNQPRQSGYIDFLDIQGQLTPPSMVDSGRNSNSSKLL